MCNRLWPKASTDEHALELAPLLAGEFPGTLPGVIFVAQTANGAVIAFIEVELRSQADGCDPSHPVGYLEGWYVEPAWRRKNVGARLVDVAESWAQSQVALRWPRIRGSINLFRSRPTKHSGSRWWTDASITENVCSAYFAR
jgi:GNAT superfamily N-acetyltransferase